MPAWIREIYRNVRRGFRRPSPDRFVRVVSDAEISAMVEAAIREALGEGVSIDDAYRRIDAGELDRLALSSELRMLRFLQGHQPRARAMHDAE